MTVAGQRGDFGAEDVRALVGSARGDASSFDALVTRYAGTCLGVARSLLGDEAAAGEVVRSTFVAVWRQAETWEPSAGSVQAWLVAMTRRRALDLLRRTPTARSMRTGDVSRALAALPQPARGVLALCWQWGLSLREAAEVLDLPRAEVIAAARSGLRVLGPDRASAGLRADVVRQP